MFSVRLEPSGLELSVPDGGTVLEAALHGGVSIPYSCRTGMCRTCKGTLVSGRLHGPSAQAEDTSASAGTEASPGDVMLLCRSVPRSNWVLHVQEAKVLEFQHVYLDNLPCAGMYERSYMHQNTVTHVLFTKNNFLVTASSEGHIKFWKKKHGEIEFIKRYMAHMGPVTALSASLDGFVFWK